MSRAAIKANPFAQLLGMQPVRLPITGSACMVVNGKRIRDADDLAREIAKALRLNPQDPQVRHLHRLLTRARKREQEQRARQEAERKAKRSDWAARHPEKAREYKQRYLERHGERVHQLQAAWARAKYRADPEAKRAKVREYYQRNREAILQRLREKKAAAKAAAAQGPGEAPE